MPQIFEYRGAEGLVYAPVTVDDKDNYTTGTVKELAGLATVTKAVDSSSDTHFYDNIPAIVIDSEGQDTITLKVSGIPLDVYAELTGQYYDADLGMLVEQEREPGYFALGYITSRTDGTRVLVWRMKGKFSVPDTTSNTKANNTDASGQELTYTGINTIHKFQKTGKGAKGINVDEGKNLADTDNFFDTVQTPDTVHAKTETPSVTLSASALSIEEGNSATITASVVPATAEVTWTSSEETVATVTNGTVAALAEGTTTIKAEITVGTTKYSDTCAVTVSQAQI